MKEQFKHFRFQGKTLSMINSANDIIEDLMEKGYFLTLRQLYYQLVARDLFPDDRTWSWTGSAWVRDPRGTKNAQPNYKWLGNIINEARLHGLIDWDAIEDRTRSLEGVTHWKSPEEIIASCACNYKIDKWAPDFQSYRIEVWVEKDALVGVLAKACRQLDVDYFSCRGYTSQTALYDASKRFLEYDRRGQTPVIIHLGDHDPSGMDMTRDVFDRVQMFCEKRGVEVNVERIALNMDQVRQYDPPPNPAKETDKRYESYREEFGEDSWELDALDPQVIDELITETVLSYRDQALWEEAMALEEEQRLKLQGAKDRWAEVTKLLTMKPGCLDKKKRKTRKKKKPAKRKPKNGGRK